MKIGDVAERTGMPASTIRYYERVGLIGRQRRVSGRRDFDERAMFALEVVKLAQTAGFSIAEVKSLLQAYSDDPAATLPWKQQAQTKRRAVRAQIKALRQMDHMLSQIITCSCPTLDECVQNGLGKTCR